MDINREVWKTINDTPGIGEETKKALYVKIMRLFEASRSTPIGKKHGVTIMTEGASAAGDPGQPPIPPKSL